MFDKKIAATSDSLIDQAAHSADAAIHTTQRVTNEALEGLLGTIDAARQQVVPMITTAEDKAASLMHHGLDSVRHTSRQLRTSALHATDKTVTYIRDEPVKSVLIAAATGAALMALARVISQSHHSH